MTVLSEVGAYLATRGVGTLSVDLFVGYRPDAPDTVIAVQEYPGMAPMNVMSGAVPIIERPNLQVVARSMDYEEARRLAFLAWTAFNDVSNERLSGTFYQQLSPSSSPALFGRDGNGRFLVGFNASCMKEVS